MRNGGKGRMDEDKNDRGLVLYAFSSFSLVFNEGGTGGREEGRKGRKEGMKGGRKE